MHGGNLSNYRNRTVASANAKQRSSGTRYHEPKKMPLFFDVGQMTGTFIVFRLSDVCSVRKVWHAIRVVGVIETSR